MADNIRTKLLADGKTRAYLVRWVDPEGYERSKQFSGKGAKRAAEDHKREVERDKRRGTYIDPKAGTVTFEQYAEQWRTNQVHRRSTRVRVEKNLRLHINPVIGARPLSSLRRSDIQALVRRLGDKLGAGTVHVVFQDVISILRSAVLDRLIVESPAVQIALPRRPAEDLVIPTVKQIRAIAAEVPERLRAVVWIGATTGLRQGEISGLDLGDVDFLGRDRELRVRRQLNSPAKGGPAYMGPPKTDASRREILLGQEALDALARHLAKFPARELPVPTEQDLERGVPAEQWSTYRLVFTNKHGAPLRGNNIRPCLRPVMARHGFSLGESTHLFRHFYASALIADGRSVKEVQEMLGHASASETYSTYLHLWPESKERCRAAIDNAFAVTESTQADNSETTAQ